MASSTRARVSRLTWELEFNTREIVPMPTEAACATSRIVVFLGTASISEASPCFRALIGSARDRDPFSAVTLAHQTDNSIPAAGWRIWTVGKKQENRCKILVS